MSKEIETRITDLEARVTNLEKELRTSSSPKEDKRREKSINEFLREKGSTTAIDIILTIAVYHEQFAGADSFNANDLLDLVKKARLKKPKNINDLINKNISKGYFEEDSVGEDGKKRWYVTNSGTELVDNSFNRNEQNS